MNENERRILNSDLLRTFVAIADCGNLTIAAGRLHRTQSAISVQLRKLESDLNARLFDRTRKGMELNEAGETLLPKARSILTDLSRASALFEKPLTGRIRIGIPDDFDDTVLERALVDFSRNHPGVDVVATSAARRGFRPPFKRDRWMSRSIQARITTWVKRSGSRPRFGPPQRLRESPQETQSHWRSWTEAVGGVICLLRLSITANAPIPSRFAAPASQACAPRSARALRLGCSRTPA